MNDMTFSEQQADGTTVKYRAAIQQVQQAHENGQMVLFLRDGELVGSNQFFQPNDTIRMSLAEQFKAAINGYSVQNVQLSRAYGSSVTAYAAANYRADTLSLIQLKVVDPAKQDLLLTPAQWYLNNASILNWFIEMSLILWGVAYLRKVYNPSKFPTGLNWLHPETVRYDDRLFNGEGGWRIRDEKTGRDTELPVKEIIFMSTFDPQGSDNGKSEYEVAMKDITTEQGMATHAASFFINRARPDGILLSKKPIPNEEKRKEIIEEWKKFEGADNQFKTWVTSGEWQFIPITQDFGQLAMPELSATIQRDIAMALRVNPILIGAGLPSDPLSAQSTYQSIERAHVDNVTLPRLRNLILAQLNRQWLWLDFGKKQYYTLVVDRMNTPVLSDVNNDTVTQASQMTQSGVADYNESRQVVGLPPRDDYILRDPQDAIDLFNAGLVYLDEGRNLVGLPDLNMGNGRVLKMTDGTVIPVSRLTEIGNANADTLINPPDPAPTGGGFFGLSDLAAFRRMIADDIERIVERAVNQLDIPANRFIESSITRQPADPNQPVQLKQLNDGRFVVRAIETVEIAINMRGNAFARYLTRELGKRLLSNEILQVAWTDPDSWHIPIVRFENVSPADAQLLINNMDLNGLKMRGKLGGYTYDETNGNMRVGLQSDDIQAFALQVIEQAQQLGLTAQVIETPSLHLGTVTNDVPRAIFDNGGNFAAQFDTVDIRFNGDVAHSWTLRHYTREQAKELDQWQNKESRHKARRSRPHARFKTDYLPDDVTNVIHWGLRLGGNPDDVFNTARAMLRGEYRQDDILLDDLATPDDYAAYWGRFDELLTEVGDDWLDKYMSSAWDTLRSVLRSGNQPNDADIGDALRANHDTLVDEWVGSGADNLGVLSKIILAGQAAGNESVLNNMPADYRYIVRGVGGVISWQQTNEQAFDFARRYTYTLIKDIDNTTRSKLQDIIAEWVVEQGATLDDLESRLEPIFTDRTRARTIANTESIRAYNEGAQERWRNVGVSRARWMTVRDQHVCPICEGVRGVVANFDDGFEHKGGVVTNEETGEKIDASKFAGRNFKPPAHPNCRCFLKPLIPDAGVLDLSDFGGNPDNGGENADDRAANDEPPPPDKVATYDKRQRMKLVDAVKDAQADLDRIRNGVVQGGSSLTAEIEKYRDERRGIWDEKSDALDPFRQERNDLVDDLRALTKNRFGDFVPRDDLTDAQRATFQEKLDRLNVVDNEMQNIRTRFNDRDAKLLRQIEGVQKTRARLVSKVSGTTTAPKIRADYAKGSKAFKDKKDPRGERLEQALDWLNDVVDGDIHNNDNTVIPKAKRGRANYDPQKKTINIDQNDTVSTLIHEIGHGIEINNPHILARAVEFRDKRKSSNTPKKMSQLTGNRGYRSDEIAYDDKWKRSYMGKIYRDRNGVDYATEIITMGLEELYNNPDDFAQSDPEYFDFIVGIIRGLI